MPRINTPVAARPLPWDRNPTTIASAFNSTISEDSASADQVSYTVPSDTKALISLLALGSIPAVAATSTTVGDHNGARATLTPSGGAGIETLSAYMNTVGYVVGDRENRAVADFAVLVAGDALVISSLFQGDAAGAGRIRMVGSITRTEFDA